MAAIYNRNDARELTPEDQMSPLDQVNFNFQEAIAKLLASDEIRQAVGEEHLDEYKESLIENALIGDKSFLDLVKNYNESHPDNPILIPSDFIINLNNIPLPDWLVPGLVLRNGLTLFYGEAGSYKTTLTIYLGYSLMTGTDFFSIPIGARYKVLYVEQDQSLSILKDQVQKIGSPEEIFLCCKLPVLWSGKYFNQEFYKTLEAIKPDVVFIDAYTSLGIEDITRPQSALCMDALRRIANEFQISIVITHHENKSGTQMGSALHIAKIDSEIQTSVTKGDREDIIMLTQGKVRGQHMEPLYLEYIV